MVARFRASLAITLLVSLIKSFLISCLRPQFPLLTPRTNLPLARPSPLGFPLSRQVAITAPRATHPLPATSYFHLRLSRSRTRMCALLPLTVLGFDRKSLSQNCYNKRRGGLSEKEAIAEANKIQKNVPPPGRQRQSLMSM
jgi:hypothetical protein